MKKAYIAISKNPNPGKRAAQKSSHGFHYLPYMATATTPLTSEHPIWEGNPSHWNNFGAYVLSVILLPVFGLGLILFLVKYLELRYTRYRLTDQRLQITQGVFSRTTKNLELYRVKDLRLDRSFLQRMVGIGSIAMVTSDFVLKNFSLEGVPDSEHLFEEMRRAVETLRIARGVREIDQNDRIT